MAKNIGLSEAKRNKNDEFYTQLVDIENELRHYKEHFKDKTVLCNCDDPYESDFFKYFALNFYHLGLKKLITTSYVPSPVAGTQLSFDEILGLHDTGNKQPFRIEINAVPDFDDNGSIDLDDITALLRQDANAVTLLSGDGRYPAGDFRSRECIELLEQADIVVTNPPFSLFREYVAQLVGQAKSFIIIGNKNAITYKEIFPLIQSNKMWAGYRSFSGGMWFAANYEGKYEKIVDGKKLINVPAIWFTNLDHKKRHEELILYKKYSPEEYPTYDNYDAIEVSKVSEIPADYYGVIGAPITFLDKYNPDQFEILGITKTWDDSSGLKTKTYPTQTQVSRGGSRSSVLKLNDGAAIVVNQEPSSTYYLINGAMLVQMYARILIRRKDHS